MATLLLRLAGPRHSWGKTSRFDARGTGREPTKAGVLGILASVLGIDPGDWPRLEPLARMALAVRTDRPGTPAAEEGPAGAAAQRYLADAAFLVGLEDPDADLLWHIHGALRQPAALPGLGRPDYLPSEPLSLPEPFIPIQEGSLREVLTHHPWIATRRGREPIPERLRLAWESNDRTGVRCLDQPLSSLADPLFGTRYVHFEWIPFPGEAGGLS